MVTEADVGELFLGAMQELSDVGDREVFDFLEALRSDTTKMWNDDYRRHEHDQRPFMQRIRLKMVELRLKGE